MTTRFTSTSRRFRLLTAAGFVLLIVTPALRAQTAVYTLSGQVLEADTQVPLPGANVRFEGTTVGAATDLNGRYTITAPVTPGTYTIVYSFLGYRSAERTVVLGAAREVTLDPVQLEPDVIGAEEVVVTGTGVPTERRQLGNAISTVSGETLERSGARSVDQALAGKVPGALVQQNSGNPAGGISIRLRGTSTVLGSGDPLYIIDGVIVNNDSPLLLDLGGGAVGGSTGSQNRLVDLNPNDIERIEVVKGAAAAALYGSRANNGVVQIFTRRGQAGAPRVSFTTSFRTDAVRKTLPVNTYPFNKPESDPTAVPVERYDFQDFIFRRAYGTEQSLSITGGSQSTRFAFSGGHFSNEGVVRGSSFRRLNGRVRVDQTLTRWAELSAGGNFSYSTSDDVPNGGITANYGALTGFIFGPNTYDPRPDSLGRYNDAGTLANPVEVIERFDFGQETRRFIGDVKLGLLPFEGFGIDYTLGLDTYTQVGLGFIPRGSTINGTGLSRRATVGLLQLNNDLSARYQTTLGGMESTTLVGGTIQYEDSETFSAQSETLTPIIEVVQGGTERRDFGEFRGRRVIYGAFAQQTLGIADKLFLTAAGRVDASSVFSKDERWQFYPKASVSYVASEERFWQGSALGRFVPSFKLRAAIGFSGGLTAIGAFDRFTLYPASGYLGTGGLAPSSQLGALDVKPERQREIEFGADVGLFDNRLGVEFTYYDQHTTDLLLERSVAPTTGYLTRLENVGTLDNRGMELLVRALAINQPDFSWSTTLTYSTNENEVNGLEQDALILGGFGFVAAINGQPLGVFYADAFQRENDDGDIFIEDSDGDIVYDANGLPVELSGGDAANRKILGDPNPDFTASWINEFDFHNRLSLRFQFDAVVGQDVFNFTRRLAALPAFGTLEDYQKELEGELPAGYNTRVFGIFEPWVEDGSFVKLREVSVSYTLHPRGLPVESVRLTLAGRNLLSFDSYSGYDPEINVSGQSTIVRNFDFVEVPIPRTFSFGVTVNL